MKFDWFSDKIRSLFFLVFFQTQCSAFIFIQAQCTLFALIFIHAQPAVPGFTEAGFNRAYGFYNWLLHFPSEMAAFSIFLQWLNAVFITCSGQAADDFLEYIDILCIQMFKKETAAFSMGDG